MAVGKWLIAFFALFSTHAVAQLYSASLRGASEVQPGDLNGSGTAIVAVAGDRVIYDVRVGGLSTAVIAAHIHRAAAGVNGPVVIDFNPTFAAGVAKGSVAVAADLADAIRQNPAGFYVNVHTTEFRAGAIRGQLVREQSSTYVTQLSGANEVSNGDLGGRGEASVVVSPTTGHVAYNITTSNLASAVVAAHIHRGNAGANGPVVIDFEPTFVDGRSTGMVLSTITPEVVRNPGGFYVNVHTTANRGGAVRGQLPGTGGPPRENYTGVWYTPGESGWGVTLMQGPSTSAVFATLYVYNNSRTPVWYVAPRAVWEGATEMAGDLFTTTGPYFGDTPFNERDVASLRVGEFRIDFRSKQSAVLTYTINNVTITKAIQQLGF